MSSIHIVLYRLSLLLERGRGVGECLWMFVDVFFMFFMHGFCNDLCDVTMFPTLNNAFATFLGIGNEN